MHHKSGRLSNNGTFKTTKVGKLDIILPKYSDSKLISIRPDIINIPDEMNKPVYDLIIGVETMAKLGIVLDFSKKSIIIDHIELPMKPLKSFKDSKLLNGFHRDHLEPKSTREATKRTIEILDAKYEKANLAEIVNEYCAHLHSRQQVQLLSVLREFEELFDGTLGDFDTDPVSLRLNKDAKPYHGRPYPIPHSQLAVFKKEVERLCELGVLA